jgi:hypothetical protein
MNGMGSADAATYAPPSMPGVSQASGVDATFATRDVRASDTCALAAHINGEAAAPDNAPDGASQAWVSTIRQPLASTKHTAGRVTSAQVRS